MTNYERNHGGRTPAEDGEQAAKRDALDPTTFANRAGSYLAIKAAKQLVEAQAELADRGLEVTDWEMIGGRVTAMELKDTDTGDKTWVDLKRLDRHNTPGGNIY